MTIWCQNLNTFKLVEEPDAFFVYIAAYNQILGPYSFLSVNSQLDRSNSYLIALQLRIGNSKVEHTITKSPLGE